MLRTAFPTTHLTSPTIRELRAFLAVSEVGSMGEAARLIGLSQPALTQSIATLESTIGVSLFWRSQNGSFLNQAGERFLPHVKDFFRHLLESLVENNDVPCFATNAETTKAVLKFTNTHMRNLIAISEHISLKDTAQNLDISEASLLRSFHEIEQLVGHSILQASMNGTRLNDIGVELAHRVHSALGHIILGLDELAVLASGKSARISVGVVPQYIGSVLSDTIDEFFALFFDARVDVKVGRYEELLADLRSGRIDILICDRDNSESLYGLRYRKFFEEGFQVAAREGHPLFHLKRKLTIEDLAVYSWIVAPIGTPRRDCFNRLFAALDAGPSIMMETNSPTLYKSRLLKGNCLEIMTRREVLFQQRSSEGRIAALPAPHLTGHDKKGYLVRSNWKPTEMRLSFIDVLVRRGEAAGPAQ